MATMAGAHRAAQVVGAGSVIMAGVRVGGYAYFLMRAVHSKPIGTAYKKQAKEING
jgi:hypothetical protein